jgi:hypothetical protein
VNDLSSDAPQHQSLESTHVTSHATSKTEWFPVDESKKPREEISPVAARIKKMGDNVSPAQHTQFFNGLRKIFIKILLIPGSTCGVVAPNDFRIFVPPFANTKKPTTGVFAHDEDEEPPEDEGVEIVYKPFRAHGPYACPPSQESKKEREPKTSGKEKPEKVDVEKAEDVDVFFEDEMESKNTIPPDTESNQTPPNQTNLHYLAVGGKKACNEDPTDDLEHERETVPRESFDNVHEAELDKFFDNLKNEANLAGTKNETDVEEVSTPKTDANGPDQRSNHYLERLPLPKFNGIRRNFFRFKQEFRLHVNYETEAEKILALKKKCLVKYADKRKVAHAMTLEKCWDILEEKYGDTDTVVVEIFSTWAQFKTPKNDEEIVKLVDHIENDVSCLKALDREKELSNTYLTVELEKKLPIRLQQEYSKSFISKKDPSVPRMKFLLSFLNQEKRACHFRIRSYSSPHRVRRVRRGCRGRGRGRCQQQDGEQAHSFEGDLKSISTISTSLTMVHDTHVEKLPTDDSIVENKITTELEENLDEEKDMNNGKVNAMEKVLEFGLKRKDAVELEKLENSTCDEIKTEAKEKVPQSEAKVKALTTDEEKIGNPDDVFENNPRIEPDQAKEPNVFDIQTSQSLSSEEKCKETPGKFFESIFFKPFDPGGLVKANTENSETTSKEEKVVNDSKEQLVEDVNA